jgi:hypothetical protein
LELKIGDSNEHECDSNKLATAEAIRKDSKKCPKCGVFIHRWTGCPSMFCTNCTCSFNWNTLEIYTSGHADNPHYFEYQARFGHALHRDGCNNEIRIYDLHRNNRYIDTNIRKSIEELFRFVEDLNRYGRHGFETHRENINEQKLRLLRYEYLEGIITKETWENRIFHIKKLAERDAEITQILDMFVTCARDLFRRYIQDSKYKPEDLVKDIFSLQEYADDALENISITYKTVVPRIKKAEKDDRAGNILLLKRLNQKTSKKGKGKEKGPEETQIPNG